MKCQSCGRQSGQEKYCNQCVDEKGNLKTFEEIVQNLTEYFVETQGFDREVARSAAIGVMSRQPAWEKKVKHDDARKSIKTRIKMILIAIVFIIVGAGVSFCINLWDDGVYYYNSNLKENNPFSNIEIVERDNLKFCELRCPYDQKLVSIDGDYVTFKDLKGSLYSPIYDHYVYNMDDEYGAKIDTSSTFFKTMMENKKNGIFFDEKYYDLRKIWHYNPVTYQISPFKGSFKNRSKKFLMTFALNKLYIFNQETEKVVSDVSVANSDCITALSDQFYFFEDRIKKNFKLTRFDGSTFEFPIDKKPIKAFANNRYALTLCNDSNFTDYLICFDSRTGKALQIAEGSINNTVISQGNSPEKTVVAWHYSERIPGEARKYKQGIRFVRMSKPNRVESLYESFDQNPVPLAVTDQYMLWDYRDPWRTNTRDKWVDGAVTSYGLRFHDFFDGRETVLEANGCDNVVVDGWNAAWEVYRGKENKEFFNIKMANLEVTNTCFDNIAYNQTVDQIFGHIDVRTVEGVDVGEIKAKFNQNLFSFGYRFNLNEDDSLAVVTSQGNKEEYLFSPKLNLAARFDKDSQQLRKILGSTMFSWEKYSASYDAYEGLDIDETKTYDPQTGTFTDVFTPRSKNQEIETKLTNGNHIAFLPQKNGSKKKIFESAGYYQYLAVVATEKGEWIVLVSTDTKGCPTVNVYDVVNDQLWVVGKFEKDSIDNIFTCEDKLVFKINSQDFETVLDLATKNITKIMLKSKNHGLASIDKYYAKNPMVCYKDDKGSIFVANAKDVIEKGLDVCKPYNIGKNHYVKYIGDWLILAKKMPNNPSDNDTSPCEARFCEISILNIKTGKTILLEKADNLKMPLIMGDYLFWEVDRGRKNLEFSNICFAKLK